VEEGGCVLFRHDVSFAVKGGREDMVEMWWGSVDEEVASNGARRISERRTTGFEGTACNEEGLVSALALASPLRR